MQQSDVMENKVSCIEPEDDSDKAFVVGAGDVHSHR